MLEEVRGAYCANWESPANGDNASTAAHFHYPQCNSACFFRRLERGNLHMCCARRADVYSLPTTCNTAGTGAADHGAHQWIVQLLSLSINACCAPVATVCHDCIGEPVMPTVSGWIWKIRRLEKTQSKHAMLGTAPELAIIKNRHAETRLGEVHPVMSRNLKLRTLP